MTGPKGKRSPPRRGISHDERPPDAFDIIAKSTGRARSEVVETFTERAAIRQYLGGLGRTEAELRALDDTRDMLGAPKTLL